MQLLPSDNCLSVKLSKSLTFAPGPLNSGKNLNNLNIRCADYVNWANFKTFENIWFL